ncbi:MAG: leucyl aminopeptidase, partial [Gemmatimonadetes bacterium]|nr:leucyl aminopeptidase [Gemmatimonadota bacterium]
VWLRSGAEIGPERVAFLGVGKTGAEIDAETLRRFAARGVRLAEELRVAAVSVLLPEDSIVGASGAARAAAEGAVLAAWRFRESKTGAGEDEAPAAVTAVTIVAPTASFDAARDAVQVGGVLAEAENAARDLQSRPGNVATPSHLAAEAERLAEDAGMDVDIFGPERLRTERMEAILSVSRGSDEEARLIVMRHDGGEEGEAPLVLVGKGLTFDAGGISIKPAKGMEEMKFDMSGGAAVIAAMWAVARLGVRRNVIGVVPSSENLLSGSAMKPGDVLQTRNGRTVEVVNTDAEGRLILCDALDYAVGLDPEAIVDCATLTGAAVIGLGHQGSAVIGTDDGLVDELRAAGDRTGERCWPLPLWPEYRKQLESETADLKNVGGRPAGTITAACFLREFVGDVPWAHLDIAGTAYGDGGDLPYRRKGGYGVPTRLLVEWVRGRAG